MGKDAVTGWVEHYERAWLAQDVDDLDRLFTEHARYMRSPYAEPLEGLDAIKGFWADPAEFEMSATVLAADGAVGVVRVDVTLPGRAPRVPEPVGHHVRRRRPRRDLRGVGVLAGQGRLRRVTTGAHPPRLGGSKWTPSWPRASSARMTWTTALMSARCVNACGKLPRWRPVRGSISSA